jgi:hypothetical protein
MQTQGGTGGRGERGCDVQRWRSVKDGEGAAQKTLDMDMQRGRRLRAIDIACTDTFSRGEAPAQGGLLLVIHCWRGVLKAARTGCSGLRPEQTRRGRALFPSHDDSPQSPASPAHQHRRLLAATRL